MVSRRPTVYDVAKKAGVSIATVSFAYRRPDEVRPATREAVLQAARELGYIPSAAARGLADGRTGALGLHSYDYMLGQPQGEALASDLDLAALDLTRAVVPWDALSARTTTDVRAFPLYVDEIQRGFELEARKHGRPVLLGRGTGAEADVTETAGRVDGLAIFPNPNLPMGFQEMTLKMPVVIFSHPDGGHYHHVVVDNAGGMEQVVEHLVNEHGITDMAFVGGQATWDYRERFTGFQDAVRRGGLPRPEGPCDMTDLARGATFEGLSELLRAGRLPRALVCASDQLALAVLDFLCAAGLSVPGDVVVTGFDGVLAGALSRPGLTSVRQPMEMMGRVAAHLLITDREGAPRQTVRLGTSLLVRSSCGCLS